GPRIEHRRHEAADAGAAGHQAEDRYLSRGGIESPADRCPSARAATGNLSLVLRPRRRALFRLRNDALCARGRELPDRDCRHRRQWRRWKANRGITWREVTENARKWTADALRAVPAETAPAIRAPAVVPATAARATRMRSTTPAIG